MNYLWQEIQHNPILWLLALVPIVFVAKLASPEAHTLLFLLAVLAIIPLATLLSHATDSVAAKTGDAVGGLLNATLGNLTELIIALAALRFGQFTFGKGLPGRSDCHQHPVYVGSVVLARGPEIPRSRLQSR